MILKYNIASNRHIFATHLIRGNHNSKPEGRKLGLCRLHSIVWWRQNCKLDGATFNAYSMKHRTYALLAFPIGTVSFISLTVDTASSGSLTNSFTFSIQLHSTSLGSEVLTIGSPRSGEFECTPQASTIPLLPFVCCYWCCCLSLATTIVATYSCIPCVLMTIVATVAASCIVWSFSLPLAPLWIPPRLYLTAVVPAGATPLFMPSWDWTGPTAPSTCHSTSTLSPSSSLASLPSWSPLLLLDRQHLIALLWPYWGCWMVTSSASPIA